MNNLCDAALLKKTTWPHFTKFSEQVIYHRGSIFQVALPVCCSQDELACLMITQVLPLAWNDGAPWGTVVHGYMLQN